jgi:phage-related protein
MATELAKAYVQIVPSAKGVGKNISDAINGESRNAGEKAGKGIGGGLLSSLGKIVTVAAVGKIITNALKVGGELEQNLGGTEAVFGNFAKNIQNAASDAYKNMGLSASDYMATANKMGSLFQGSGLKQERALELTTSAMQRAADVASVMGLDTTMAMDSIAGAAKGNFTMMDNLGVAMNATTLQAYALEKGLNFDWKTASNAEKAELAMKMFMDRTSQYAGNFARESEETFSGSLGAMKASFSDLLGAISTGEGVGSALSNLGGTIVTFAKNLLPMVGNIIRDVPAAIITILSTSGPQLIEAGMQAINNLIIGLAQSLPSLIPTAVAAVFNITDTLLKSLPQLIESGMGLLKGLVTGIINALPLLIDAVPHIIDTLLGVLVDGIPMIVETGITLISSLVEALPTIIDRIVAALPPIINAIIATLVNLTPKIIDAGIRLIVALVENLPAIITGIVNAIPLIINSLLDFFVRYHLVIANAGVQLFKALIQNLPTIIATLLRAMPEIIKSLINALKDTIPSFARAGLDLIEGLWEGIKNAGGWLKDKIKGWAGEVIGNVKNFFKIGSPSKVFADDVGRWLPIGLAEGVQDNTKSVTNAMEDLASLTTGTLQSELALSVDDGVEFGISAASNRKDQEEIYYNAFKRALSDFKIEWNNRELGRMVKQYA